MFEKRFLHSPRSSLEDGDPPIFGGREEVSPVVELHRVDCAIGMSQSAVLSPLSQVKDLKKMVSDKNLTLFKNYT